MRIIIIGNIYLKKKTLKNKVLYSNMVIIFKLSFKWYISSIHAPVLCSFIIIIIEKKYNQSALNFDPNQRTLKIKWAMSVHQHFFNHGNNVFWYIIQIDYLKNLVPSTYHILAPIAYHIFLYISKQFPLTFGKL